MVGNSIGSRPGNITRRRRQKCGWIATGIRPEDVWKEMDRRERLLGIAEKVPKKVLDDSSRRKIVALESRRLRKRR